MCTKFVSSVTGDRKITVGHQIECIRYGKNHFILFIVVTFSINASSAPFRPFLRVCFCMYRYFLSFVFTASKLEIFPTQQGLINAIALISLILTTNLELKSYRGDNSHFPIISIIHFSERSANSWITVTSLYRAFELRNLYSFLFQI